jgi:CBS domain-containing protein
MRRWLYAYRSVSGDPSVLEAHLRSRLPDLLLDSPDDNAPRAVDGSVVARLHGEVASRDVSVPIRVWTGVARHEGARTVIPVRWRAAYVEHVFPDFEGTIEIERQSRTAAQVTLTGTYRPPLGPIGAAFDAIAVDGVAHETADRLVAELAKRLERAAQPAQDRPRNSSPAPHALTVGDVMTADPVALAEQTTIRSAAQIFIVHGISGAPVVSPAGALVGVLSESDLLDKEAAPTGFGRNGRESTRRHEARTVGEACTRPAIVTSPDARLHDVAELMRAKQVSRLVVVAGSEVAGVVTRHDVLKALCRTDTELQAAVDAVVASADKPKVDAVVDWSVVRLQGHCALHSVAERVVAEVEDIDGVVGVDSQLTWAVDDLAAVPMM